MLALFTISYPINVKTEKNEVRYLSEFLSGSVMSSPTAEHLANDLIFPSDYEKSEVTYRTTFTQTGPDETQTSLFMIGKVSVSVIFMESNGTIDPETEDWDQTRIDEVNSEIETALNWYTSKEPDARLQWVIHSQKIETSYEPITRSSIYDYLWINEAMNYLGYNVSGTESSRIRPYLDDLRDADGTHWAFVIFVVDSLNDPDGVFLNGAAAYAHYSGPYFVTTYDANGYRGLNRFDAVIAHETAHIFQAADEYPSCYCDHLYGFLEVENLNCTSGCDRYEPYGECDGGHPPVCQGCYNNCYHSSCLMDDLEQKPLTNQCLTVSTKYQIGWRDEDKDGILDAIDSTYNSWNDTDGDGVVDYLDNCPDVVNPDQADTDGDWEGDVCDGCVISVQYWNGTPRSGCEVWTIDDNRYFGTTNENGQIICTEPDGEYNIKAYCPAGGSRFGPDTFFEVPGSVTIAGCVNTEPDCNDNNNCTTDTCYNPGQWNNRCEYSNKTDGTDCGTCCSCSSGTRTYDELQDSDCDSFDLPKLGICTWGPDDNPFTWDYHFAIDSVCQAIDTCTYESGYYDYTHTCNITQCGAECETDFDCLLNKEYCLDDCTCRAVFSLSPNPIYAEKTVTATIADQTGYDGKTVYVGRGIYRVTVCSCTIVGGTCSCSFTSPKLLISPSVETYYARVDKNGDKDYNDSEEEYSQTITVQCNAKGQTCNTNETCCAGLYCISGTCQYTSGGGGGLGARLR